ncbi:hypothetical protein OPQ81_000405 [Rhizoctonia solani]|nr:hypothetical protein OPQ81_000405 [Rhizoctonia solani]
MKNLPEGGVILCGHSMGGLLTAEAAFAAPPGRVVGLVSFDVPYLGVHPRVVKSGIASLFKRKEELTAYRTSSTIRPQELFNELNGQVCSEMRTSRHPASSPPDRLETTTSTAPDTTTPPSLHLSVPKPPIRVIAPRTEGLFQLLGLGPVPQSVHNFLHFWDKHPGITGLKDGIVQIFEFGGCLLNPQGLIARYERLQRWGSDREAGPYGRGWVNLWTTPMPREPISTEGRATTRSDDSPRLRSQIHSSFLSPTPSESSLNSTSFESSLFQTTSYDPSLCTTITSLESVRSGPDPELSVAASLEKLRERLSSKALCPDKRASLKAEEKELKRELQEMRRNNSRVGKETKARTKKAEKERTVFLKAALKRREQETDRDHSCNFIVLPKRGTDHQWIRVPVVGAQDEITAHCGLFFRDENPGYQKLIQDVGNIVRGFWDGEGGLRHSRQDF